MVGALIEVFVCPIEGKTCPYWCKGNTCCMNDPLTECDHAPFSNFDYSKYPYVWQDKEGNRYTREEVLNMGYHFVNGTIPMKN